MTSDSNAREIGELVARVEALRGDMSTLKSDVRDLRDTLNQFKGASSC